MALAIGSIVAPTLGALGSYGAATTFGRIIDGVANIWTVQWDNGESAAALLDTSLNEIVFEAVDPAEVNWLPPAAGFPTRTPELNGIIVNSFTRTTTLGDLDQRLVHFPALGVTLEVESARLVAA